MVHHSVDQRPRTHRPVAGGRRRAHGMWSRPGPGQCARAAGAHATETVWPAEQSEALSLIHISEPTRLALI
eukprot:10047057-Alexandrium_andersonii.AAC.1